MNSKSRLDFASLLGLIGGPFCILLGQWIEGGRPTSLLQGSAALIVIGATIGASMLSFSPSYLWAAVRDLRKVISEDAPNPYDLIERMIGYATVLRRDGPVALQRQAHEESYALLATGLNLVVNNVDEEAMATVLERAYHERTQQSNAGAEVFEAAGGYLPTFGILGAVIGLIHTMQELSDPSRVGEGIAAAFVATVYGVSLANLVAYPVARKIRARARTEQQLDKLVVVGVKGLRDGMAPSALRQLLTEGLAPAQSSAPAEAKNPQPEAKAA